MESTIQKRMNNLLVRIGDEGVDFYYKNLEKLINITPQFMKQDDTKKYFLNKFKICIQKIPYKSFIYAIFYAIEINNYPEFESLIDQIFDDLQKNINELNLLEADNVLLFLGELIKLNVLNSFTYISILMDLVSGCENFQEHFEFFFYLTLNSIAHVQKELQKKFEMEFKNLIEDLERIVQTQINKNPNMKERWLFQYFQSLKDNINLKEPSFELKNTQCLNLLKNSKSLRKTFKLNIQIDEKESQCSKFISRQSSSLFDSTIDSLLKKQNSLNKHLLDIYIHKNFLSYEKNINLLLDKFFYNDFGNFKSVKDFLIIKYLLLLLQSEQKLQNQLISSVLIAKLINCFDFYLFFNDCWKHYQNYLIENLANYTLQQLDNIVNNVAHLNYLTNKNFEFKREDQEVKENNLTFLFIQDLMYLAKINYNLNKEDAYNNHNIDPRNSENENNDYAYSYLNQYLLSNSDSKNFFLFSEQILGMKQSDQKLRQLFFSIFIQISSQSFIHFKSYFEHYKQVLNQFLSSHDKEFYSMFIKFNSKNYFVLQKCLVYLYQKKDLCTEKFLDSIANNLYQNDQRLDICLLKTLKEIQNIQKIYGNTQQKDIKQLLAQKLSNLKSDENNKRVQDKYLELFN